MKANTIQAYRKKQDNTSQHYRIYFGIIKAIAAVAGFYFFGWSFLWVVVGVYLTYHALRMLLRVVLSCLITVIALAVFVIIILSIIQLL